MTAPERSVTGEARPCANGWCGHAEASHGLLGCRETKEGASVGSVVGCICLSYQPPAPPSVGDATPGLLERVLIAEAERDGDATPERTDRERLDWHEQNVVGVRLRNSDGIEYEVGADEWSRADKSYRECVDEWIENQPQPEGNE